MSYVLSFAMYSTRNGHTFSTHRTAFVMLYPEVSSLPLMVSFKVLSLMSSKVLS